MASTDQDIQDVYNWEIDSKSAQVYNKRGIRPFLVGSYAMHQFGLLEKPYGNGNTVIDFKVNDEKDEDFD